MVAVEVKQHRLEVSAVTLALAAAAGFALFSNNRFWHALLKGHSPTSSHTWLLAAGTFIWLTAGHFALILPFTSRYVIKPFLTVLLVVNALTAYFIGAFNVIVDRSMIINAVQTDVREVRDLITSDMMMWLLFGAVLPIAFLWRLRLRRETLRDALRSRVAVTAAAFLLTLGAAAISYGTYASFFRNQREVRHLITPGNSVISGLQVAFKGAQPQPQQRIAVGSDAKLGSRWKGEGRPVVFVLVVGETARAANFSLDGYGRDTNPSLRRHQVINFSDVSACGTSTAESLPCMFSPLGRSHFTESKARQYETVLDVFRHAGFSVHWLDNNSGCKHVCDGLETERLYQQSVPGNCEAGDCLDQVLLTHLDEILTGKPHNQVIVLHQKGSHGPAYYRRYPKAFERFTPACQSQNFDDCTTEEIRNAYDNSILYTDFILGQVIDDLAASRVYDSAMLYISDHGESLGERGFYLHGLPYSIAPDAQKKVPMVLWMSSSFTERFAIDLPALHARARDEYSHDNLFHSMLGLLDVRTADYRRQLDIFATTHTIAGKVQRPAHRKVPAGGA